MKVTPSWKWLLIPMALVAAVRRHQMICSLRGSRRQSTVPAGSANSLTPEESEGAGHRGRHAARYRCHTGGPVSAASCAAGCETALNDNQNQEERERAYARGERDRPAPISALDGGTRPPAAVPRAVGRRPPDRGLLQDLQRRQRMEAFRQGRAILPVGLGTEDGDGKGFSGSGEAAPRAAPAARAGWKGHHAKPSAKNGGGGLNFPTSFGPAQKTLSDTADRPAPSRMQEQPRRGHVVVKPVYGAVELDADGLHRDDRADRPRAVDGTSADRRTFKVFASARTTSPPTASTTFPTWRARWSSGTAPRATGRSFVRGQIRSVTFVFNDGTVRTMPEDGSRNQSGGGGAMVQTARRKAAPGWISDPTASPCVSGERRSNAQRRTGSQALITAAGAGAAAIKSDSGSVAVVANSTARGTVGISGNEAMGRIHGRGRPRHGRLGQQALRQPTFAAVYVRPGAGRGIWSSRSASTTTPGAPGQSTHQRQHASDLD